jgi:hypothetical protein
MAPKNWRNPLGLGLAGIHAAVLIFVIVAKEPLPSPRPAWEACPPKAFCFDVWAAAGQSVYAGRPFHFHYETWLVKFLMIADMPGMLAASVIIGPLLATLREYRELNSYVAAFCWIAFGSLQWWTLGTYVTGRRTRTSVSPNIRMH